MIRPIRAGDRKGNVENGQFEKRRENRGHLVEAKFLQTGLM